MKSALATFVMAACACFAAADERTVVIPRDTTAFKVDEKDVVRLTGKGIAGARIEAKVSGPAKLAATGILSERAKGYPVVGPGNREFEIRPTGKGKVVVTVTSTPPQPDAKPTVTKYEFQVE